jgi:hypothetical protein
MVSETCTVCLDTTRLAPWDALEPSRTWVCQHCMQLTRQKRKKLRKKNAKKKICANCGKPFAKKVYAPLTTLILHGYWFCSPQCHPYFLREEKQADHLATPGSLAYYKREVGWWTEREIRQGDLAEAEARDQSWDEFYRLRRARVADDDGGCGQEEDELADPEKYGQDPQE